MESKVSVECFRNIAVNLEKVLELKDNVQNVYTGLAEFEGKIEELTKVKIKNI